MFIYSIKIQMYVELVRMYYLPISKVICNVQIASGLYQPILQRKQTKSRHCTMEKRKSNAKQNRFVYMERSRGVTIIFIGCVRKLYPS